MSEQPKLKGTPEPWHHVAREFGDCEMVTEGSPYMTCEVMRAVDDAYYVGDYVPAETVCKEVVALRAKLDAIHRWLDDRADVEDPDQRPNAELRMLSEFFEGRGPDK